MALHRQQPILSKRQPLDRPLSDWIIRAIRWLCFIPAGLIAGMLSIALIVYICYMTHGLGFITLKSLALMISIAFGFSVTICGMRVAPSESKWIPGLIMTACILLLILCQSSSSKLLLSKLTWGIFSIIAGFTSLMTLFYLNSTTVSLDSMPSDSESTGKKPKITERLLKYRVGLLLFAGMVVGVGMAALWVRARAEWELFLLPSMSESNQKGGVVDAVGQIGGASVLVPKGFDRFVTYKDTYDYLDKRQGPAPLRTYESEICGLRFETRYPDMALVTPENWRENYEAHNADNMYTTRWMRVTVQSNSDYPKSSMTQFAQANFPYAARLGYPYVAQAEKRHGLTVFKQTDSDLKRLKIARERTDTYYLSYDENSVVGTYIECSNVSHEAAPCSHWFDLSPAMKARVKVHYRRGMLPHWREIQSSVSKTLLGFCINTPCLSSQPSISP